ncbi:IS982 family transposase, partial [Sphaerospermopsis kisseleviana CS-549]|nr:IS982 family transposase [Sphaerospermopsis kisseleviana CS-549]
MLNEIIAIYAITDDLLKAIGHEEDSRRVMSDAEIITTAICAAMYFNGNHSKACIYMQEHGLIPNMLDKSRFNRRLHGVFMLMNDLFHQMGMILKEISDDIEYL